ncbi:MAG: MATE family efflux transporter [Synergistaceae bacterium]|nr:MATE family efflux transporter [Synergistaceae bacterium]
MKMSNTEALEKEPVGPLLIRLSAPAMAGMFLLSLYNVVDAFFVGRGVGPLGIAAVFILYPAVLVIMAIGQTFGVGGASVISRLLGAKRHALAERALGTTLTSAAVAGLLLTAALLPATRRMVFLFGGSQDIIESSVAYGRVIFAGAMPYTMMMTMNNLVRGEGNTRLSMCSMAISAGTNMVLDPIFIFVFRWGVTGAAVATVISQMLALAWLFSYYIGGRSAVALRVGKLKPSLPLLFEVLRVGVSAFTRQIGIAFAMGTMNKIFSSTGGDIAVAASGIVQRMNSIIIMPMIGMGHGLLPIVGYNYGARNAKRVADVMKISNVFATIFCTACSAVIFIFPTQLLGFFSSDPALLSVGVPGARLLALGLPAGGGQIMLSTYYQGTGKGGISFFLSMLRPILLHPAMAVSFALMFGLNGAWASFPISEVVTAAITWLIYIKWRGLPQKEPTAAK